MQKAGRMREPRLRPRGEAVTAAAHPSGHQNGLASRVGSRGYGGGAPRNQPRDRRGRRGGVGWSRPPPIPPPEWSCEPGVAALPSCGMVDMHRGNDFVAVSHALDKGRGRGRGRGGPLPSGWSRTPIPPARFGLRTDWVGPLAYGGDAPMGRPESGRGSRSRAFCRRGGRGRSPPRHQSSLASRLGRHWCWCQPRRSHPRWRGLPLPAPMYRSPPSRVAMQRWWVAGWAAVTTPMA